MLGLPDLSGGGEGVATNYGIVGGPVPSDATLPDGSPNPYASHFDTVDQLNASTAVADQKTLHAINPFNWGIPWYFWTGLSLIAVLAILHELNPTLELLHDVVKSK